MTLTDELVAAPGFDNYRDRTAISTWLKAIIRSRPRSGQAWAARRLCASCTYANTRFGWRSSVTVSLSRYSFLAVSLVSGSSAELTLAQQTFFASPHRQLTHSFEF